MKEQSEQRLGDISQIVNENFLQRASYEELIERAVLYDKVGDYSRAVILKKRAYDIADSEERIIDSSLEITNSYHQKADSLEDVNEAFLNLDAAEEWLNLSEYTKNHLQSIQSKKVRATGRQAIELVVSTEVTPDKQTPNNLEKNDSKIVKQDFESVYDVGDNVLFTYVPAPGFIPTDGEKGYEPATIIGKHVSKNTLFYQLGGVNLTNYKRIELSEQQLLYMQEVSSYLIGLQKMNKLHIKSNNSRWSKIKKLLGFNK